MGFYLNKGIEIYLIVLALNFQFMLVFKNG